jgi:hypothetical protein
VRAFWFWICAPTLTVVLYVLLYYYCWNPRIGIRGSRDPCWTCYNYSLFHFSFILLPYRSRLSTIIATYIIQPIPYPYEDRISQPQCSPRNPSTRRPFKKQSPHDSATGRSSTLAYPSCRSSSWRVMGCRDLRRRGMIIMIPRFRR